MCFNYAKITRALLMVHKHTVDNILQHRKIYQLFVNNQRQIAAN